MIQVLFFFARFIRFGTAFFSSNHLLDDAAAVLVLAVDHNVVLNLLEERVVNLLATKLLNANQQPLHHMVAIVVTGHVA